MKVALKNGVVIYLVGMGVVCAFMGSGLFLQALEDKNEENDGKAIPEGTILNYLEHQVQISWDDTKALLNFHNLAPDCISQPHFSF